MTNKDLFKQAIAEAKTIREAAITNAKEALEESLTPHLKEMLAQKLQEMEEQELEEDATANQAGFEDYSEDSKRHGNIGDLKEEEEEAEEAEEADGEEVEGEEEEEMEIEDMTIDDLKDLIKDIIAQEAGHEEELSGEEAPEGMEDMVGSEEEEININELLAEIEEMEEGHSYSLKPGAESGDTKGANDGYMEEGLDENIDVIAQLIDMFPFLNNNTAQMLLGAFGVAGLTGFSAIVSKVQEMALKGNFGDKAKAFAQNLQKQGGAAAKARNVSETEVNEEDSNKEMDEALNTIEELRTQLQEVNLLNAKLLYVNKVFKANNLSEGQKVNVIAAFDKAETVREVKLVFETVSKNVVAKKPATIKEHTFASKATGTTAAPKKEVISEVSEQVKRMQFLAGIKTN